MLNASSHTPKPLFLKYMTPRDDTDNERCNSSEEFNG